MDYAKEREEDLRRALAEAKAAYKELSEQIGVGAPKAKLLAVGEKVDAAINKSSAANNQLAVALTAMDLTTGSPEIGKPTISTTKKSE